MASVIMSAILAFPAVEEVAAVEETTPHHHVRSLVPPARLLVATHLTMEIHQKIPTQTTILVETRT